MITHTKESHLETHCWLAILLKRFPEMWANAWKQGLLLVAKQLCQNLILVCVKEPCNRNKAPSLWPSPQPPLWAHEAAGHSIYLTDIRHESPVLFQRHAQVLLHFPLRSVCLLNCHPGYVDCLLMVNRVSKRKLTSQEVSTGWACRSLLFTGAPSHSRSYIWQHIA